MILQRVRPYLRGIALCVSLAALICAGLTAYCAVDVARFYIGAEQFPGEVIGITKLPGGDSPLVQFVDSSGSNRVEQFSSFYASSANAVGAPCTVLCNSSHPTRQALAAPQNWIGSKVYGTATTGLLMFAGVLLVVTRQSPRPLATSHDE